MTDQDIGMTDADAAERTYRVPFVSIDDVPHFGFTERVKFLNSVLI